MNYKDLKKLEDDIKNESKNIDEPDVYHKVKDSPIRKLKKGERPSKYFSRKTGLALLAFLTIIMVILAILFLAMVLSDAHEPPTLAPVIVSVDVEKAGTTSNYYLLCENSGTIKYAIKDGATISTLNGKTISNSLETMLSPKDGDIVNYSILSSDVDLQSSLIRELKQKLTSLYSGKTLTQKELTNSEAINKAVTFVNSKTTENNITIEADIFTIYSKLSEIAENLK